MAYCDKAVFIKVGEKEYSYQVFYNDKGDCEAVRFYDEDGFLAEFLSVEDMNEYLGHAEPDVINREWDMIKRFRKKCDILSSLGDMGYSDEVSISDSEKTENHRAFVQRINILKGDMSSNEFGRVIGLNQATTYNLIKGTRSPGMNPLKRIADKCGVSVDWLIGRE